MCDINREAFKEHGLDDEEIAAIDQHLKNAPFIDTTATLINVTGQHGEFVWVARTVAEAIKAVRPDVMMYI